MKLRQNITQDRYDIKAAEIEAVVVAVVKSLVSRTEMPVQRICNPRIIKNTGQWRDDHVAQFTAPGQRDIRREEDRTGERGRERLIPGDALQNFLLADVGIVRARGRVPIFNALRRYAWSERRLRLPLK